MLLFWILNLDWDFQCRQRHLLVYRSLATELLLWHNYVWCQGSPDTVILYWCQCEYNQVLDIGQNTKIDAMNKWWLKPSEAENKDERETGAKILTLQTFWQWKSLRMCSIMSICVWDSNAAYRTSLPFEFRFVVNKIQIILYKKMGVVGVTGDTSSSPDSWSFSWLCTPLNPNNVYFLFSYCPVH